MIAGHLRAHEHRPETLPARREPDDRLRSASYWTRLARCPVASGFNPHPFAAARAVPGVGQMDERILCEKARADGEFEIQFARDGDNARLTRFHVRYFAAWEFERTDHPTRSPSDA